jgi:RimJ/RimL family protein N-acetyltransferase
LSIRIEPLAERHLQHLSELVEDPATQRFTRVPVPLPEGFVRTWFDTYVAARRDGTREAFAIVDGDEVLGVAVAPRIDAEAETAELGYVVTPSARGRGVASEALRLLTHWAFTTLGAQRLELLISFENDASKHVAERCGYSHEGLLRSLYVKPGVREDTEIWSRLPSDPPYQVAATTSPSRTSAVPRHIEQ